MKLGFFFGAGAECSYGLPSGGKFAIDIFKANVEEQKKEFKKSLNEIDERSPYARKWLPSGFAKKPVYAFGKSEFGSLLQSSIEYRSDDILENLAKFDKICEDLLKSNNVNIDDLKEGFKKVIGTNFGEFTYEESVKLNKILVRQAENKNIFSSKYYSALLDLIEKSKNSRLKKYASAILQLFVCVIGQKVIRDLNQELFEQNDTNLSIFDDMTTNFNMDFSRLGVTILEIVLDNDVKEIDSTSTNHIHMLFENLFALAIGKIFENCLDYRKLVDEHFRYLYTPRTQWAKFTKMVIFLRTVRDYIVIKDHSQITGEGYYHDLAKFSPKVSISTIGTSNYNCILGYVANKISLNIPEILFLNGGVRYFYNPYKNLIIEHTNDENTLNKDGQLVVPFIMTQSGLKPLTSISASQKYVSLFESYRNSDAIVCIGFGFNSDDAHINGVFRQLVDDEKKHLFYVTNKMDADEVKDELKENMRIGEDAASRIHIVVVDANRQYNNQNWTEYVESKVEKLLQNIKD